MNTHQDSHEDEAADEESPLDPELDGDVSPEPAQETLSQVLAGSDEDEVLIRNCRILSGILNHLAKFKRENGLG